MTEFILLSMATLYLIWIFILAISNKGKFIITSKSIMPRIANKISRFFLFTHYETIVMSLFKVWRLFLILKYIIGYGTLIFVIYFFFYRLHMEYTFDLIYLPLSFFITIFIHELGHAIAYIKKGCIILAIHIGIPLFGKTTALPTGKLTSREKIFIGFSGSASNLITTGITLLLLLFFHYSFLIYFSATNLLFFSNSLFSITKDYKDILNYLSFEENF